MDDPEAIELDASWFLVYHHIGDIDPAVEIEASPCGSCCQSMDGVEDGGGLVLCGWRRTGGGSGDPNSPLELQWATARALYTLRCRPLGLVDVASRQWRIPERNSWKLVSGDHVGHPACSVS